MEASTPKIGRKSSSSPPNGSSDPASTPCARRTCISDASALCTSKEVALADARLADQHERPSLRGSRTGKQATDPLELRLSAEQPSRCSSAEYQAAGGRKSSRGPRGIPEISALSVLSRRSIPG